MGINKEECLQRLQLACGKEASFHATVFRWLTELDRDLSWRKEDTEKPLSAVSVETEWDIRKTLILDNRFTCQVLLEELDIGSVAIREKIIHEDFHMKIISLSLDPL
ncbi:hypothetical protein NPIL_593591 [Nephila pilipes]|uniref:Uncharacterized protein n=1 Tax=Nephila pilipes TaxID=299642 RepID=A0A8X6PM19_NEPPI|nr:hypothetical protein NPIL_593591 [Nephila pilipes]